MRPDRIISGGQTGADRTALEVARTLGIPTGGFCPLGCRTEDGPQFDLLYTYGLVEMSTGSYADRTYANVVAADGTVLFGDPYSPGGKQTVDCCKRTGKPFIINPTPQDLRGFMVQHNVHVLNVAGNRYSKNPRIADMVTKALVEAFS